MSYQVKINELKRLMSHLNSNKNCVPWSIVDVNFSIPQD